LQKFYLLTPASLRSDGVAGILRNSRPEWIGTGGRNAPEWVADITGIGSKILKTLKHKRRERRADLEMKFLVVDDFSTLF